MLKAAAVVAFAIACDSCRKPNPAEPIPVRLPAPYVVNADVKEALLPYAVAAIAGARVEIVDGPDAGKFCLTDDLGRCTLGVETPRATGTLAPVVRATKEGFRGASKEFIVGYGIVDAIFILARDSTPDLSGAYDITVTAADSCTGLSPDNRAFPTSASISHPTNPSLVLLQLQAPGKCNYLFGLVRPNGDVELGHDVECNFPNSPGPLILVGPPLPRIVTAEGSWTGRVVDGVLTTLAQSGSLFVTAPGVNESCQAPDHRWELRRK